MNEVFGSSCRVFVAGPARVQFMRGFQAGLKRGRSSYGVGFRRRTCFLLSYTVAARLLVPLDDRLAATVSRNCSRRFLSQNNRYALVTTDSSNMPLKIG